MVLLLKSRFVNRAAFQLKLYLSYSAKSRSY